MKLEKQQITILWHRTAILTVLCFFGVCLLSAITPPPNKKGDDRIYLVHSDELKYDNFGPNPEAQIVKGRVHFSHQGAHLWCDSAYFYQAANTVKAFGHVRFKQGDTLSLSCTRATYDGQSQMMEARKNVVLTHRKQTLKTDSLNYDRLYNNAYFFEGGTLTEGKNKLVSDWGQYDLNTREAVFYYNVRMRNEGRLIETDTLYYDTRKSLAHIVGENSRITDKESTVETSDAYYNTKTDMAQLYGRSTMQDKQKTITGDSLYYTKNGESYGYGNVVYVDKENKNSLLCDELRYNEKTGYGYATKHAMLMDYSQGDTLYVHSDSMKIYTFNINTDSVYRKVHCFRHVQAYRNDVQAICDSLVFNSQDSCMTMYKDPIVWNEGRQLLGEKIDVFMNDSTIRYAHVIGQASSIEQMYDKTHYNQIKSREMMAYFTDGRVRKTEAIGNVSTIYFPIDEKDSTLMALNYLETDTMRMYISDQRKMEKIWTSKFDAIYYPMTQIPTGKDKLDNFAWFENLRPKNKNDIFIWRGKGANTLKVVKRQTAPLQKLE